MQITSGKIPGAVRVCLYGPEGIGKSTLAAQFPDPLFIDTENGTAQLDVKRLPKPDAWIELLQELDWVYANPTSCKTLVVDTADWAERLCIEQVCAKEKKESIEAFSYGKGYTYVAEEFGRMINKLENIRQKGIHIVIVAHAKIQKFELPDELGAYDRWSMKTSKQVAPMIREYVDALLFLNYKTLVINVDGQGAQKGKNKAQGGARVMYTTHSPSYDAKNRFGLADELPLEYKSIAPILGEATASTTEATATTAETTATPAPTTAAAPTPNPVPAEPDPFEGIPAPLARLMQDAEVTPNEVKGVIASKGFFPYTTPWSVIAAADGFLDGWLMHPNVWPQVVEAARQEREKVPF